MSVSREDGAEDAKTATPPTASLEEALRGLESDYQAAAAEFEDAFVAALVPSVPPSQALAEEDATSRGLLSILAPATPEPTVVESQPVTPLARLLSESKLLPSLQKLQLRRHGSNGSSNCVGHAVPSFGAMAPYTAACGAALKDRHRTSRRGADGAAQMALAIDSLGQKVEELNRRLEFERRREDMPHMVADETSASERERLVAALEDLTRCMAEQRRTERPARSPPERGSSQLIQSNDDLCRGIAEAVAVVKDLRKAVSSPSSDDSLLPLGQPSRRLQPAKSGRSCGITFTPDVEIALTIYSVCNVDTKQMTYEVDFLCHLDWCDPAAEGMTPHDLLLLDWDEYFNPQVDIHNAKDSDCSWLPGGDEIPRRPPGSEFVTGTQLRKTMRFRGTLALNAVNLRCFPFDVQVLPIRIKAARSRNVALLTAALAGAEHGRHRPEGRVQLVDSGRMMHDRRYIAAPARLKAVGHYAATSVDEALLEFNLKRLAGGYPDMDRSDVYEVHLHVERPIFGSYFWELMIMNVLVFLSATAFWDTAAPEISSRMSISLTVILTLAAYTSSRPAAIEKAPYVTFHDWVEQVCMFLVTGISIQNVVAVVTCGGQHPEAPAYMQELFQANEEGLCAVGWCYSRNVDCRGIVLLVVSWFLLLVYSVFWLIRNKRATKVRWSSLLCLADPDEMSDDDDGDSSERAGPPRRSSSQRWCSRASRCPGLWCRHCCCRCVFGGRKGPEAVDNEVVCDTLE
eukprot:TRINITY_DN7805_c0_g1_i1.p1 TRINITY_DN7805_c0_g1~~TRINITY_DN7805_c0_g1_i1.p1  ORF type:complete len:795 (+),score=144.85 TRINITY_DN7805_c0_g1_i1:162-2387(+)